MCSHGDPFFFIDGRECSELAPRILSVMRLSETVGSPVPGWIMVLSRYYIPRLITGTFTTSWGWTRWLKKRSGADISHPLRTIERKPLTDMFCVDILAYVHNILSIQAATKDSVQFSNECREYISLRKSGFLRKEMCFFHLRMKDTQSSNLKTE